MKEAILWHRENGKIRCDLCGRRCLIPEGKSGACLVRKNIKGKLYTLNYGKLVSVNVDPIEKKPLFHFHPGSYALSIASAGCNFMCKFCFAPETIIFTSRGMTTLQKLFSSGKSVRFEDGFVSFPKGYWTVTHRGRFSKVVKAYKHFYEGEMILIKPYFLPEIKSTPSHEFFVFERGRVMKVQAKDLNENHFLISPKLKSNRSFSNRVFGWDLENPRIKKHVIIENGYYLIKIRKIRVQSYSGDVYNIEVADKEHSYLPNFVAAGNCCNYEISQVFRDKSLREVVGVEYSPEDVVDLAVAQGCKSISYTYTEPTVFFEFALDTARLAHKKGIKNTFVTNGYMTPDAVKMISPYLDAATVDFKGSGDPKCYREFSSVPDVQPIFDCLLEMKKQKIHVEITNLIIPKYGDDMEWLRKLAAWIREQLGKEIAFHILRFFPTYRVLDLPQTPLETLEKAYEIAKNEGLEFVYLGNVPGKKENTYCPNCGELLIERFGLSATFVNLEDSTCPKCRTKLPIII